MISRKTQYLNSVNDVANWLSTYGLYDFSRVISIRIERCNDYSQDHQFLIIIETDSL